jgi:RHS repeat-associated protein
LETAEDYWQVQTQEGLTSWYGTPLAHRAAGAADPAAVRNPEDPGQIAAWRLTRTADPFGNRVEYNWSRDRGADGPHLWDVPELAEIRYIDSLDPAQPGWLVTIGFDWEERPDPFSDFRSGFEVRTRKRLAQVVVRVAGKPQKIFHLRYAQAANGLSLLTAVQVEGRDASGQSETLPPLTFTYSGFTPQQRRLTPVRVPELPAGSLLSPGFELVDTTGKGLPDVVELAGARPRVWRNLGHGTFSLPREMKAAPAGLHLGDPGVQLLDADGNGQLDLMVVREGLAGVFPMRFGGGWDERAFRPFALAPSFRLGDPEVRLLDLDGDGATDAVRAGADALECFFQDPVLGWKEVRRYPRKALEGFPNVSFSDPRVRFADMSGDGLQDLVLVQSGKVEYWPARGRGRWGRRVEMRGAPRLPDQHDPRRLLLGDVDGDGCADLIYVEDRRVLLWLNRGGQGFGEAVVITGTPPMTSEDAVRLIDLEGAGTAGLLWVTPSVSSREHLFFLDLTGGAKPYLMTGVDNHLGAVTRITYAASTRFFLEDEKDRRSPWRSPLPFPVQVVAGTETIDQVSGGRLSREFRYHHGYWDGAEREFRGFGRVDQRDSESFAAWHAAAGAPAIEPEHFSPPTETRTWFHQGPQGDAFGAWHEADHTAEFWAEDPPVLSRPAAVEELLARLPRRSRRDALRALRGRVLRGETYALDGTARQGRPYTVTEAVYGVSGLPGERPAEERLPADPRALPEDDWRLAVFFPFLVAQRSSQWERGDEPRVQASAVGRHDAFGQPGEQIEIAVPRSRARSYARSVPGDVSPYLATLAKTSYALSRDLPWGGRVASSRGFEVVNRGGLSLLELCDQARRLSAEADAGLLPAGLTVLSEVRNYYDGEAFLGLPAGQLGRFGALTRSEQLAMDEAQLQAAFGTEIPPFLTGGARPADWPPDFWSFVAGGAGYRKEGDRYYTTTQQVKHDFQAPASASPRGLTVEGRDARGRPTRMVWDDRFGRFLMEQIDPAGLSTRAEYDLHFLQAAQAVDANGNGQRVTFAPLGWVASSSAFGKTAAEGDKDQPGERYEHDFSRRPIAIRITKRLYHDSDPDPAIAARKDETLATVTYWDGSGRAVASRTQAEERVWGELPLGGDVLAPDPAAGGATRLLPAGEDRDRVVVSGFKRYDNKGQVVEAAEPYFASGWDHEPPRSLGAVSRTFYDPLGGAVRTVNADGSETRGIRGVPARRDGQPDLAHPEEFLPSPWEIWSYDVNDNAGRDRSPAAADPARGRVAKEAFQHHVDTPSSIELDALERTVAATQRLRPEAAGGLTSTSRYDLRGNPLEQTDAKGRKTGQGWFDYLSRPLKSVSLDGGERWALADAAGFPVWARDSRGALTLSAADAAGRPQKTWERDQAGEAIHLRRVVQHGDADIPDAAERQRRREKNLLGKLLWELDAAGRIDFEAYDFHGNLVRQTRRALSDAAILGAFAGLPAAGSWRVPAWRPDWSRPGADADLDAVAYTREAAFDAAGRPKWMLYPLPGGTVRKLVPAFNRAGALSRLEIDGRPVVEQIGHNARGQRILAVYACADRRGTVAQRVLTRYAYEPASFRLLRLRSEPCQLSPEGAITPLGNPWQDTAYAYDLAGNLWQIAERSPGSGVAPRLDALDRRFTYDALYRLASATGRETDVLPPPPAPADLLWAEAPRSSDPTQARSYAETYTYDEMGFLLELVHKAGAFTQKRTFASSPADNRLQAVTYPDPSPTPGPALRVDYTYDVAGNTVREATNRHFEWDSHGRLRVFRNQTSDTAEPTLHAHYLYDANGGRVKKLVRHQGGAYEVTVSLDGLIEHRYRVQGATRLEGVAVHLFDKTRRLAVFREGETFDGKPADLLVLDDHLGSVAVELDLASGRLVDREEYTPFGETSFGSYRKKRYRFTGQLRDEESGLSRHGSRYYAPALGRWLSPDPAGAVDGLNLYAYVRNNPLRFYDPTGQSGQEDQAANSSVPAPWKDAQDFAKDLPAFAHRITGKGADRASLSEINMWLKVAQSFSSQQTERHEAVQRDNGWQTRSIQPMTTGGGITAWHPQAESGGPAEPRVDCNGDSPEIVSIDKVKDWAKAQKPPIDTTGKTKRDIREQVLPMYRKANPTVKDMESDGADIRTAYHASGGRNMNPHHIVGVSTNRFRSQDGSNVDAADQVAPMGALVFITPTYKGPDTPRATVLGLFFDRGGGKAQEMTRAAYQELGFRHTVCDAAPSEATVQYLFSRELVIPSGTLKSNSSNAEIEQKARPMLERFFLDMAARLTQQQRP